MNVDDVTRVVAEVYPDSVMVSSLGTATSAVRKATADGPHFYLGAAMGCALGAAIGLAEAVPEREVVAVLGDGDFLMGANTLWTLAALRPQNLVTVVLADRAYSITGNQPILQQLRLPEVCAALTHISSHRPASEDELRDSLKHLELPAVIEVPIEERAWPGPSPFVDPPNVVYRLREDLRNVSVGAGTVC